MGVRRVDADTAGRIVSSIGQQIGLILNVARCASIIAVIIFQAVVAKAGSPTALSEGDLRRIDAYIESQLQDANIPGAALVVVENGHVIHARGYGVAGPNGRPVTAETGFYLGSVTKSFTALAIMQLVEAGRVDLQASVEEYLPWFCTASDEVSSQIKVQHLLNHTSGFSTYTGRTHLAERDRSEDAIERRVRALSNTEVVAPPGERFQYSNANYSILGAIIESVTGQSYEDYVREQLFQPLSMTNSYASHEEAMQHDLATGFRYWFGRPAPVTQVPHSRGELPSMLLISCAHDMGNYLLAHMNRGELGNERILSEEGIFQLHTPEQRRLHYAMGWEVRSIDGARTLSHIGITPESHVGMAIFPEHQRGFVLLVNAQNFLSGPDVPALFHMVELQMLGMMALPVAKAPSVHPDLAMLCMLMLGQLMGLALVCRRIYRRYVSPHVHSTKRVWDRIATMIGSAVELGLAVYLLWWIPKSHEIPFAGLMLYAPDAGWLIAINGGLAIATLSALVWEASFLQKRLPAASSGSR